MSQRQGTQGKRRKVKATTNDGCFKGCYLLTPIKKSSRTYIGYTVNPIRRLRQHNGDVKGGARKTAAGRPWQMELVVYGFPNNITALRFEWAWQNPHRSTRIPHVGRVKSGVVAQLGTLAELLHASTWARLPLSIHFINREAAALFQKLEKPPPDHMHIRYGEISPLLVRCANTTCDCSEASAAWEVDLGDLLGDGEAVPRCESGTESEAESDTDGRQSPVFGVDVVEATTEEVGPTEADAWASGTGPATAGTATEACICCFEAIAAGQPWVSCTSPPCANKQRAGIIGGGGAGAGGGCKAQAHVSCFADYMLSSADEHDRCIPVRGQCPACNRDLLWGELIASAAKRPSGP
eukprot:m.186565 g.186565  ORF g.186565 m.186565 type:complete len:352 (+) comp24766_c0_seq2:545-1600(+)